MANKLVYFILDKSDTICVEAVTRYLQAVHSTGREHSHIGYIEPASRPNEAALKVHLPNLDEEVRAHLLATYPCVRDITEDESVIRRWRARPSGRG